MPGSKSITNRALILAALADGPSLIRNGLLARDTRLMIGALESLFGELLDVSKLDAGAIAVQPRNFALQELFDRLSLEFHAEAVSRDLRMRFVPTSLAVRTDPVLLERVLANLVSNALRYTSDGGVVVGARRRGLDVWIDVVDTGVGIPPEQIPRLFEMFYQADPALDRAEGGLGIGLTLVHRLLEMHGGTVEASSGGTGLGSEFVVRLPLSITNPTAHAAPACRGTT